MSQLRLATEKPPPGNQKCFPQKWILVRRVIHLLLLGASQKSESGKRMYEIPALRSSYKDVYGQREAGTF